MSLLLRPLVLSCLLATGAPVIFAQPSSSPGGTAAHGEWQRLRDYEYADLDSRPSNQKVAAPLSYLARADELRDFRQKHTGDPHVPETRRLEALMLLYAGRPGDKTLSARRDELVAQVRADNSLPAPERFAIASLADHSAVMAKRHSSETARLKRHEEVARALLQEFPGIPEPLDALLNLADDCPDDQLARIASDVLKLNPPSLVRARAEKLLARHALVGRRIDTLLTSVLAAKDAPVLKNGRVTVLYTWASWHPGSLLAARDIAAHAPAFANIVGVNLDTDVAAARKIAAQEKLPGAQLYDSAALNSKLAAVLQLTGKDVVYVTNPQGVIGTVSARRDLVAQLGTATN